MRRRRDATTKEFASGLAAEHAVLAAVDGLTARWGVGIEPLPAIPHGEVIKERLDGVLEAWTETDESVWAATRATIDGLGSRLAGCVDAAASAVVVGRFHPIIAGTPEYLLVYPLRRLPGMTQQAFGDYWLRTHSRDAIDHAAAAGGYGQLHADAALTAEAARVAGLGVADFDGICEAGHLDLATFTDFMSGRAVARGGIRLESQFIDHSRSALGLIRPQT